MKPEYQGEGSYTYSCDKPNCTYCVAKGLKPITESIESVYKHEQFLIEQQRERSREYQRMKRAKAKQGQPYKPFRVFNTNRNIDY